MESLITLEHRYVNVILQTEKKYALFLAVENTHQFSVGTRYGVFLKTTKVRVSQYEYQNWKRAKREVL